MTAHALAAQLDAGLGQLGERHRAEALGGVLQPGRVPGHPAGGGAEVEGLRRLVEVDRDRDQLGAALDPVRAAGGDEEVDQACPRRPRGPS